MMEHARRESVHETGLYKHTLHHPPRYSNGDRPVNSEAEFALTEFISRLGVNLNDIPARTGWPDSHRLFT